MTGQVLRFDAATHQTVEALLPWFVNHTLDGAELALVERHVNECARCQREVEWLRNVQTAYVKSEMEPDVAASFRKLRSRLGSSRHSWRALSWMNAPRRLWMRTQSWARWAIVMQTAAIFVLGSLLSFGEEANPAYHTLDAARQPMGRLVAVFDPHIAESELRRMVRGAGARIVDGPTVTDAYVLELPADRQAAAIRALRMERAVALVEPLRPIGVE